MVERAIHFARAALSGDVRLVRFLIVGGLNTFVGYSIFSLLLWLGLHYSLSSAISTVLGVLFNFKSTGSLVFKSSDNRKILRFVLVYAIVYGVNVAGLAVLLHLGIGAYQGGLVLILPLALLAYCLNARYVFPRP
jgi:putative flippase GtrA